MVEACRLFDSLEEKNSIVWAALFSGYVKLKQCEAFFDLLREYIAKEAAIPDALILINAFNVCAFQAALGPGKQIHGYVFRMGIEMDMKTTTAMIDMYSKCGSIPYAEKLFLKVIERDLVLYNVMLAGYAHHGHEIKAINLFQEMLERGVGPDAVTFVALLSACRHRGLVDLGEKTFYSMTEDYHILPETDHYACMIDLYGRASQLEKMVLFMQRIPVEHQDAAVVGAFFNACRLNNNTELAKEAEEKLLNIEGDSGARYVQLANVYAAEGNWAEMGRIRREMRGKEAKKFAGCSWVYLDNEVHSFTSGDRTHTKAESIYSMLEFLKAELYEIAGAFR
jgi:pentatricopeptide repeat protein